MSKYCFYKINHAICMFDHRYLLLTQYPSYLHLTSPNLPLNTYSLKIHQYGDLRISPTQNPIHQNFFDIRFSECIPDIIGRSISLTDSDGRVLYGIICHAP